MEVIKSFKGVQTNATLCDGKLILENSHSLNFVAWCAIIVLCFFGVGIFVALWAIWYVYFSKGKKKVIYLKRISSVEFNDATTFTNGYFEVNLDDSQPTNLENRVYFTKAQQNEAQEFVNTIDDLLK